MDDDQPLSALAKPKKVSYDDDMPLAGLAGKPASKKGRPSTTGPKPVVPASGEAKGKSAAKKMVKKQAGSSSSSDSSYSSSDSSTHDSERKKKQRKIGLLRKKREEKEGDNEDNRISKKERAPKEQLVAELLCRWWYALPEWPPSDPAYYKSELAKRNLRQVSVQEWEWVPDEKDGKQKVYPLSQFKGLYRKVDGTLVDVRPQEGCPSHNNIMKKDMADIVALLVKAYEGQLKDLQNSKYDETELEAKLKGALNKMRLKLTEVNDMSSRKRKPM